MRQHQQTRRAICDRADDVRAATTAVTLASTIHRRVGNTEAATLTDCLIDPDGNPCSVDTRNRRSYSGVAYFLHVSWVIKPFVRLGFTGALRGCHVACPEFRSRCRRGVHLVVGAVGGGPRAHGRADLIRRGGSRLRC